MLMRNVPSSVAVITAHSYDDELDRNVPMGVAVSSLSTVSLDPPTISFNIKQPSKTLDAIRGANGLFRVHFPLADRGGANMVDLFSRGNHPEAYTMRMRGLNNVYLPSEHARADRRRRSESRAPQIMNDSVRAAMECTLTQELTVADHVILVAKVDSLESKRNGDYRDRTILYVDGSYMRPDGSKIAFHQNTKDVENDWSIWDYPLFPGEEERRGYMERIKTIIKKQPQIIQHGKQSISQLEAMLPISPSKWGINLEQLIEKCREETGMPPTLPTQLKDLPILSDFYGRLIPSDRAKMAERVKTLVEVDGRFLSLNYRLFLQNMGISAASIDLLPSDIAEPLRAEGLLGPPHPASEQYSPKGGPYDLLHFEQIEKRLIERLRTMPYEKVVGSHLDQVAESLGEPRFVATYFKRSRARLYAAAYPSHFRLVNFDILGKVSPEQARVVMSRFIRYLDVVNTTSFRRKIHLDYHEILRLNRIHPSITGFDVEYLVGKLKHMYLTTRFVRDLPGRIDEMIEPWFTSAVTWADFEQRVHGFVHKMPSQAMSWSTRDKLAAMGLHPEAVLDVPISSNKQPLSSGHILDTLVAKELKNLHGNATPVQNQAIARFLKSRYDFDVNEAVKSSPAQALSQPSGDDMLEAMMAGRNVDVRGERSQDDDRVQGTMNDEMREALSWRHNLDVPVDKMDGTDSDQGWRKLPATVKAQEVKRKR
jgi:flavin reductase (DIM6/NTAB) family NADH-FMN oxidoreductase RutF